MFGQAKLVDGTFYISLCLVVFGILQMILHFNSHMTCFTSKKSQEPQANNNSPPRGGTDSRNLPEYGQLRRSARLRQRMVEYQTKIKEYSNQNISRHHGKARAGPQALEAESLWLEIVDPLITPILQYKVWDSLKRTAKLGALALPWGWKEIQHFHRF